MKIPINYKDQLVLCIDNSIPGGYSVGTAQGQYPGCREGIRIYSQEIDLPGCRWTDALILSLNAREGCGEGWGNCRFVAISESEKDELLSLSESNRAAEKRMEIEQELSELRAEIDGVKRPELLPTVEQAKATHRSWTNLINEGGEGYVTHILSCEAYASILTRIDELTAKLS